MALHSKDARNLVELIDDFTGVVARTSAEVLIAYTATSSVLEGIPRGKASQRACRDEEIKLGSRQGRPIFYPMCWPKDTFLWQDWFEVYKLRLFGADRLCLKKVEFGEFEPILLQIFPTPDWIKKLVCLVKEPTLFLESRPINLKFGKVHN